MGLPIHDRIRRMKNHVLILSIAAAIISMAASLCAADAPPSETVVKVQVDFPECKGAYCVPVRGFGSGVIVSGERGRYAVATNHHVIREALKTRGQARYSIHYRGRIYQATPIVTQPTDDVAILQVITSDELPVAELGDDPQPGQNVVSMGYPDGGRLVELSTRVDRKVRNGDFVMPGTSRGGHSGGGVFRGRQLVGLHWGKDAERPESHAVEISKLKHCLKAGGLHWREKKFSMKLGDAAPFVAPLPPAPPPPPEKPNAWYPDPGTTKTLDDLSARLKSVEDLIKNIPAGAPGPPGPAGTAGAAGPIGPMGPAGVVTVILIGPDGKEQTKTEHVAAGSTVRLNVTKFLQKE